MTLKNSLRAYFKNRNRYSMSKRTKIWMAIFLGLPVINLLLICLRWVVLQAEYNNSCMLDVDDWDQVWQTLDSMFKIALEDLYYFAGYSFVTWIIAIVVACMVNKDNTMRK